MGVESDNVQALKNAYARWAHGLGGDISCWQELLAEDCTLRSLADGGRHADVEDIRFTAPRAGKAEILAYLAEMVRGWSMVSYMVHEYVAQGDRVVAIGEVRWRNRATGKIVHTRKVDVWTMRDGRAVSFEEFYDTAGVIAAATPDPA